MGKKQRQMKKAAAKAAAAIVTLENALAQGTSRNTNAPAQLNNSSNEAKKIASKKKIVSDDSTSTESAESCGSSESDTELMPALEDCNDESGSEGAKALSEFPQQLVNIIKQSRGEKKARRLLQKLDLKPIEGVSRVAMCKSKNILLYIENPDVFKCPHSDTYVFFGEVKVDDISTRAQVAAAEKFKNVDVGGPSTSKDSKLKVDHQSDEHSDGEEENYDIGELDEKDIELVMMQANTTRGKAAKALHENDNDVVNAIMALTML